MPAPFTSTIETGYFWTRGMGVVHPNIKPSKPPPLARGWCTHPLGTKCLGSFARLSLDRFSVVETESFPQQTRFVPSVLMDTQASRLSTTKDQSVHLYYLLQPRVRAVGYMHRMPHDHDHAHMMPPACSATFDQLVSRIRLHIVAQYFSRVRRSAIFIFLILSLFSLRLSSSIVVNQR